MHHCMYSYFYVFLLLSRCFFNINPDKGTKVEKTKKKTLNVNPRVLTLISLTMSGEKHVQPFFGQTTKAGHHWYRIVHSYPQCWFIHGKKNCSLCHLVHVGSLITETWFLKLLFKASQNIFNFF